MAIKIQGTVVVDDSRNITNGGSANLVSLAIGGDEITQSVAKINQLVGVNTSSSLQSQINNISIEKATLTKTFTLNETSDIQLTSNTVVSPAVGVVKNVSGTLTGAVPGTDYTYTFINSDTIRFQALVAGDFRIRIA